jgi:hypothetical protein
MGLFGGDSSSSNTTNNLKKDLVVGNGSTGGYADNGGTVTVIDAGAVAGAFDVVKNNGALAADSYNNLLTSTGQIFGGLMQASGNQLSDLISAQNTASAGILSGIASTQNFIQSTLDTAQSKGTLDNKTIVVLGVAAAAALAYMAGKK